MRLGPTARAIVLAALPIACAAPEDPDAGRTPIFTVALDAVPGGALLSAWLAPGTERRGYIVGGYVGLDPARAPGGRAGRLLRYEAGALTTTCTTDRALWWVHAARASDGSEVVYAAGEGARVLRVREGRCEALDAGSLYGASEGAPTFFGLHARAADDVTFVGGFAGGSRNAAVLHFDGTRFERREGSLPAEARARTLYKITEGALGAFIVGERGTLLRLGDGGAWSLVPTGARGVDDRLFTVSCDVLTQRCFAVGGAGEGLVLRGDPSGWHPVETLGTLPGLAGVSVQDARSVFIVGAYGLTLHTNDVTHYRPAVAETRAGLHAVASNAALTLAVGGELDAASPDQRAVVLTRGELTRTYALDGVTYAATGNERPTLGAGVGGSQ